MHIRTTQRGEGNDEYDPGESHDDPQRHGDASVRPAGRKGRTPTKEGLNRTGVFAHDKRRTARWIERAWEQAHVPRWDIAIAMQWRR